MTRASPRAPGILEKMLVVVKRAQFVAQREIRVAFVEGRPLSRAGCAEICEKKASGKSAERIELERGLQARGQVIRFACGDSIDWAGPFLTWCAS